MPRLRDFFRPVTEVAPRPDPKADPDPANYVRSFVFMRLAIGILGVLLPVWLILAGWLAFDGNPAPRGLLSAYYYSGMRDVFVGILCATGVFLITHQIAEVNLDNTSTPPRGKERDERAEEPRHDLCDLSHLPHRHDVLLRRS